ncbi:hypothetical protein [Capnocytophaga catalasegens]|uniref:Uncharacterized protein n=1 Tax=Capnocytophaga catalasegens TaxID=1004260 RepID=A0AAV5ARC0_9FLAO|nr:hypothetical protein [Capnocytophaga catalasegens]GIZ15530.1 hypothetical protein RCZ03_15300 [Capnocytophaga catalasegens]GJM49873.1 hypothetical protein RCZ15_08480 [Capnocytophaga catalasegens]GJM54045.1 hypothetical protein RCZ16_23610 [Capnocytophaga catalasegens]
MTIKNKRKKIIRTYTLTTNVERHEPSFLNRLRILFWGKLYIKYVLKIAYKGKLERISPIHFETRTYKIS